MAYWARGPEDVTDLPLLLLPLPSFHQIPIIPVPARLPSTSEIKLDRPCAAVGLLLPVVLALDRLLVVRAFDPGGVPRGLLPLDSGGGGRDIELGEGGRAGCWRGGREGGWGEGAVRVIVVSRGQGVGGYVVMLMGGFRLFGCRRERRCDKMRPA